MLAGIALEQSGWHHDPLVALTRQAAQTAEAPSAPTTAPEGNGTLSSAWAASVWQAGQPISLPSGCAAFDHWTVALDEETKTFTVEIYNSVPAPSADVACTMIYGLVENSIPLNGVESGHTYTVNVNDHSTTFESQ